MDPDVSAHQYSSVKLEVTGPLAQDFIATDCASSELEVFSFL